MHFNGRSLHNETFFSVMFELHAVQISRKTFWIYCFKVFAVINFKQISCNVLTCTHTCTIPSRENWFLICNNSFFFSIYSLLHLLMQLFIYSLQIFVCLSFILLAKISSFYIYSFKSSLTRAHTEMQFGSCYTCNFTHKVKSRGQNPVSHIQKFIFTKFALTRAYCRFTVFICHRSKNLGITSKFFS